MTEPVGERAVLVLNGPDLGRSYVSAVASGVIVGLGVAGYALALRWPAEQP